MKADRLHDLSRQYATRRWLDNWLSTREGTAARSITMRVQSLVELEERRRRQRKDADAIRFTAMLDMLVANLLRTETGNHPDESWMQQRGCDQRAGRWTAVTLGNYARPGRNALPFSLRLLSPLIHKLVSLGIVILKLGRKRHSASLIAAGPRLISLIESSSCGIQDSIAGSDLDSGDKVRTRLGGELIVLQHEDGTLLSYRDTARTLRWSEDLQRINEWLRKADLGWADEDIGHVVPVSSGMRRTLTRIFHNGSFEYGGRLYGAFWQTMRRGDRTWLRIEGERVAVLDYRALYPRLLYALAGEQAPSGDLYEGILGPEYRSVVKTIMSALPFKSVFGSKIVPRGQGAKLPPKMTGPKLLSLIHAKHPVIAQLLPSDPRLGFRLMFLESEIILKVLIECKSAGIVALPIHDAVMVPCSKAAIAKQIMLSCYQNATGGFTSEVAVDSNDGEAGGAGDAEDDWI